MPVQRVGVGSANLLRHLPSPSSILPLLMLLGGGQLALLPASESDEQHSFSGVLSDFIPAWDARNVERLDEYIDPELGFWVVYNIGIAPAPYRFHSLSEVFSQGRYGFGYVGATGFGDCQPSPGSIPDCGPEGNREASCHYGKSPPVFLESFDWLLYPGIEQPDQRPRIRRERDLLASVAGGTVSYISDSSWGSVFFFANTSGRWRLLVIDTSDCSA